jgi:hypothetical protein
MLGMIAMSNQQRLWKPVVDTSKPVSRIRRDPPPLPPAAARRAKLAGVDTEQREAFTVVTGVILFAIAIAIITVATSAYTS